MERLHHDLGLISGIMSEIEELSARVAKIEPVLTELDEARRAYDEEDE